MCSLGYGNFCASDWNDLPARREFERNFLENVKTQPHANEKKTDHLLDSVSTEGKFTWFSKLSYDDMGVRMTQCKPCISTFCELYFKLF